MDALAQMMREKEDRELEYLLANKELFDQIESLKEIIRQEIMARKAGDETSKLKITYRKGAVRWNTSWLDGYSLDHPEILKYRKVSEPSVGFSLKSDGMSE